ncbi:hypothetical protein OC834_000491 [Tilletia horrida]|nr:hypothetical protein OC834_000491 [Tilletia horrida]
MFSRSAGNAARYRLPAKKDDPEAWCDPTVMSWTGRIETIDALPECTAGPAARGLLASSKNSIIAVSSLRRKRHPLRPTPVGLTKSRSVFIVQPAGPSTPSSPTYTPAASGHAQTTPIRPRAPASFVLTSSDWIWCVPVPVPVPVASLFCAPTALGGTEKAWVGTRRHEARPLSGDRAPSFGRGRLRSGQVFGK